MIQNVHLHTSAQDASNTLHHGLPCHKCGTQARWKRTLPKEMVADTAFGSDDNFCRCKSYVVELAVPILVLGKCCEKKVRQGFHRDRFSLRGTRRNRWLSGRPNTSLLPLSLHKQNGINQQLTGTRDREENEGHAQRKKIKDMHSD